MSEWKTVIAGEYELTERAAAPGGWIYRTYLWDSDGTNSTTSMCFVPDPCPTRSADDPHA